MREPRIASLSPTEVAKLETVERKIGNVYVIAYDEPLTPAQLSADQVKLLQQAEQELGKCLVAYQQQA